jgi:hypothetical protein
MFGRRRRRLHHLFLSEKTRYVLDTLDPLEVQDTTPTKLPKHMEERFAKDLEQYRYFGSDEHLRDLNEWLCGKSHASIRPPWEDEEEE